jgi:dTDP-4-dehydrorhamnose 3,5-epimerase-like enzyme
VGLLWNDKDLAIPWPLPKNPIISERDQKQASWAEVKKRL